MIPHHLLAIASSSLALGTAVLAVALSRAVSQPNSSRRIGPWNLGRTMRFPWSRFAVSVAFATWFLVAILLRTLWLYRELAFVDAWRLLALDLVIACCLLAWCVALGRRFVPWILWFLVVAYTVLSWLHMWHWRFFEDILALGSFRAAGQARFLGESVVDLARGQDFVLLLDVAIAFFSALLVWRFAGKEKYRTQQDLQSSAEHAEHGKQGEHEKQGEDRLEGTSDAAGGWRRKFRARSVLLAFLALAATAVLLRMARPSDQKHFMRVSLVKERGLLALHLAEVAAPIRQKWLRSSGALRSADAEQWFLETADQRGIGPAVDPAVGPAEPWNVIVVQVESFQDFALDLDVGEPPEPVMPNLRKRLHSGFRFPNTLDQTHLGRTSDAEMLVMASLLPVSHTSAALSYGGNKFSGLPGVLAEHGYSSFSAIAFDGSFWNRRVTHPSYGFQQSYFVESFDETGEKIGWGLNDREFLTQTLHLLGEQSEPFFSFLITLSLHTPYLNFPEEFRSLPEVALKNQHSDFVTKEEMPASWHVGRLENYLEAMRFFDTAFEDFMRGLEESGLSERTVVVLYGDHDSGLVRDPRLRRHLEISKNPSHQLAMDRVPMVFWVPKAGGRSWGGWTGEDSSFVGLVDVAPTLFGVLGLDAAALPWQGRNLRRAVEEPETAQWRRSPVAVGLVGSWISPDLVYISKGPGPYRGRCYRKPRYRKTVRKAPCVEGALQIERQLSVARDTLEGDLQGRLRLGRSGQ